MTLGEKIAALRQANKLTQKDLAEKLSISDKIVSRWETGRSLPDVEMMKHIANALNTTISDLYDALDEKDCHNEEKENYERVWQVYDYNRIWSYKRWCIIACALSVVAPVCVLFWNVFRPSFTRPEWPISMDEILASIFFALTLVSLVVSVVMYTLSTVSLSSFSKTKYYKLMYKNALKFWSVVYWLLTIVSVVFCVVIGIYTISLVTYAP